MQFDSESELLVSFVGVVLLSYLLLGTLLALGLVIAVVVVVAVVWFSRRRNQQQFWVLARSTPVHFSNLGCKFLVLCELLSHMPNDGIPFLKISVFHVILGFENRRRGDQNPQVQCGQDVSISHGFGETQIAGGTSLGLHFEPLRRSGQGARRTVVLVVAAGAAANRKGRRGVGQWYRLFVVQRDFLFNQISNGLHIFLRPRGPFGSAIVAARVVVIAGVHRQDCFVQQFLNLQAEQIGFVKFHEIGIIGFGSSSGRSPFHKIGIGGRDGWVLSHVVLILMLLDKGRMVLIAIVLAIVFLSDRAPRFSAALLHLLVSR
mmetsp:Transcript_7877/g.16450  ORF Transcript_7877/g.16450 Transcript_7877/m.16450 type:complete len:318 (+) Transcript_7877:580-1533(+)